MKKVKLFSHTDFDGIGCAVLGKLAFKEDIDITYCDYNNVNEKVRDFYFGSEKYNYDMVFITDISVNEEIAEIIDNCNTEVHQLIDHHPTALELNKYAWCKVLIENEKGKCCGTALFYDLLLNIPHKTKFGSQNIRDFVETVRQYDTWEWSTKYNNPIPKQWNDLLYIMGRDRFVEQMIYKLTKYDSFDFNDIELLLLDIEADKKKIYFEKKNKELIIRDILSYKAGIVFADQYLSELGNELAKTHEELDFIAMISNCHTVGYRSIKTNIDLGKDIAKIYGGGGHPQAAGSQISEKMQKEILDLIFKV